MNKLLKYSGLILLSMCIVFLNACSLISKQAGTQPGKLNQTSIKPHATFTPAFEYTENTLQPTLTRNIATNTKEPEHINLPEMEEFFSNDYALESNHVYSAFITRDGRTLVITLDDAIAEIIDLNSMQKNRAQLGCEIFFTEVISIDNKGNAIMLCSDYSEGEQYQIWKINSGESASNLNATIQVDPRYSTTAISLSPNGEYLALGFHSGEVNIYKTTNGSLLRQIKPHIDNVTSLAFSPNGKNLLTDSWSFDLGTYVFDVASGSKLSTLIAEGVGSPNTQSVWFSPDGSLAAGVSTLGVEVFSSSDWTPTYSLPSLNWGKLGCDNKTWFDYSDPSQVLIYSLETGKVIYSVPTVQLFCLEDKRAAWIEFEGEKVTMYAFTP